MVRVIYRRASHAAASLPLCFARITEKVTIKSVMQIHNIMVSIFITCAVISHLFFTLWSISVTHFFFFFFMIQALFKVNNFQYE